MKLNLGCGGYPFPGWKNYDNIVFKDVIRHDLATGLPEKNNTVDLIFSEHFLEHLTFEQAEVLLKDCLRVLKPGGKMRVVMPDLFKIAKVYISGEWNYVEKLGLHHGNDSSMCRFFNQAMRAWGHQFLWDETYLISVLNKIGFKNVKSAKLKSDLFPGNRNIPTDLIIECEKE